jgi:hypothetical protein
MKWLNGWSTAAAFRRRILQCHPLLRRQGLHPLCMVRHELDCDPGSAAGGSPPAADGLDLRSQKTSAPAWSAMTSFRETSGDRRWAPLVEASFADFKEAMRGWRHGEIHVAGPCAAGAGPDRARHDRGRKPARTAGTARGRLSLARRSITRHLSQASLSAAMVADLLGYRSATCTCCSRAQARAFPRP